MKCNDAGSTMLTAGPTVMMNIAVFGSYLPNAQMKEVAKNPQKSLRDLGLRVPGFNPEHLIDMWRYKADTLVDGTSVFMCRIRVKADMVNVLLKASGFSGLVGQTGRECPWISHVDVEGGK